MTGLQPFDPVSVFLIAALNPVVIAVAFLMGRAADQWQKLIVAGFAAALAGSIFVWMAALTGILPAKGIGGEAGVFVFEFLLGMLWAWVGFKTRRRQSGEG